MDESPKPVKLAVYGYGRFCSQMRVPNFLHVPNVHVAAVADLSETRRALAKQLPDSPRIYTEAMKMVEQETVDILVSIVPPEVRGPVECTAATKGVHIFTEKPQVLDLSIGLKIDAAIRKAGVRSEVGFRERYRPLIQAAKRFLDDKKIVHFRYELFDQLPAPAKPGAERVPRWSLSWGCHAVDYLRFITGLDVIRVQAFYHWSDQYNVPLSASMNFQLRNGATGTLNFLSSMHESYQDGITPVPHDAAWLTIYYEGGYLAVHGYEKLVVNEKVIYEAGPFDPWAEQIRCFVEAVRYNDPRRHLGDFHDGLRSLAPILAALESSRRGGIMLDVGQFLEEKPL